MLIVDAHEDIAWNMMCYGRDYTQSAQTTRARDSDEVVVDAGTATLGLPEWLAGQVAVIFATLYAMPERSPYAAKLSQVYRTPDEAFAIAMRQIDIYRRLAGEDKRFRLITEQPDLDAVLDTWKEGNSEQQIGLVLLMENGDPIRKPQEVARWYDEGVRLIGPAWMASRYCGGTGEPGPLTDEGVRLLKHMQELNMILDTTHMAEQAFFQAIDQYGGSIIATHSNPRAYVDGDRHLSDEMIRALVRRDGVIGIVPFNSFLVKDWSRRRGDPKDAANVSHVVRAIDRVCQIAGDALHAGLGTDFDGGFGAESTPAGIDTVADLPKVADGLREAGFSQADVENVMGGNWLRVLRVSLPG
ncbi:MAG TPA: membrane dipeptidase [Anaerolineae bacterium]|nr:membrane dipeptidase [Anaerolineae bacterium]